MNNVLCVIGTRPEAIKMAPVILKLRQEQGLRLTVCLSGQHEEMANQVLSAFGIVPNVNLGGLTHGQSLNDLASKLITRFAALIAKERPTRVLVHGDTTTAMACATAAFHAGVPTGHVEAGLRTGDMTQPFPEEFNRRVIDMACDLLFANVIPALAIARELRGSYGAEVELLGTSRGIETRLVPEAGFPLHLVEVGQLANVSLLTRARTSLGLPLAVRQCLGLLGRFRPHMVIGVGGYASGPAMLAAIARRYPTMVYEPNAYPGMVNRTVGRFVGAAAVAYEETMPFFRRAVLTGVPVRQEIVAAGPLQTTPPRLLVTAGSNGARVFNEMLPELLPDLLAAVPGLTVVHQTGERAFSATEAAFRAQGLGTDRVHVAPFLRDMPAQLDRATLVMARAGSTVAELAAAGRPALLVPFPRAADDHQTKNALAMVRGGAAEMLPEATLTPALLLDRLSLLLRSPHLLTGMSLKARSMSRPGALKEIAAMAHSIAKRDISA